MASRVGLIACGLIVGRLATQLQLEASMLVRSPTHEEFRFMHAAALRTFPLVSAAAMRSQRLLPRPPPLKPQRRRRRNPNAV